MKRVGSSALAIAMLATVAMRAGAADFDCVIEPRQVVEIRSPIEGLIERVHADRGDLVAKGQVIATIDASVDRAAAALAKQRMEMEGAVRSGESRVEFSTKKAARAHELHRQNFVSAQSRDEAATESKLAESELQDARDNRRIAELDYKRQMEIIRLKTIRSPIDGVVVERVANVGELAEAGVGRKPIFKLAEIDILYVEVLLPVEAYGKVTRGMEVEVVPEIPAGTRHRATVKVVDRLLDAASGTFGVRLELPNKRHLLPAGIRCKASFAGITTDGGPRQRSAPPDSAPRQRSSPLEGAQLRLTPPYGAPVAKPAAGVAAPR